MDLEGIFDEMVWYKIGLRTLPHNPDERNLCEVDASHSLSALHDLQRIAC